MGAFVEGAVNDVRSCRLGRRGVYTVMEPRVPLSFTRELKFSGQCRSSPCILVASNLRQYSLDKKHLTKERPNSAPKLPELDESDLIGGNGRWRQRKAETEFERRAIEEAERSRQLKVLQEEKRRRKAAIEERRRRQLQDSERAREEEKERQRREQEEKEQQRREKEVRERQRREEEEREWLRRQPQTCETCGGLKRCNRCLGKGYLFDLFLVSAVQQDTAWNAGMDYGKVKQGCEECGGYRHNVLGELKPGTGNCPACLGVGKIKPNIEPLLPYRRRFVSSSVALSAAAMGEDGSPMSGSFPASPLSTSGGG